MNGGSVVTDEDREEIERDMRFEKLHDRVHDAAQAWANECVIPQTYHRSIPDDVKVATSCVVIAMSQAIGDLYGEGKGLTDDDVALWRTLISVGIAMQRAIDSGRLNLK